MQFFTLATALGLATIAAAQSSTLYFTNAPSNVQAGQPVVLKYVAPNSDKPVEIILRQGPKDNLATLATLTTTSKGGSYSWTPAKDLVAATNYALEIKQGDQSNFIGPFSLSGGLAFSATSTSAAATPSAYDASSSSLLSAFSSLSSVLKADATSAFSMMTPSPYASFTLASASGIVPMSRNTTFQSATLRPTNVGSLNATVGMSVTPGNTKGPAATGATGTTPAAGTSGASSAKIPVAFILVAITAAMYLA